MSTIRCSFCGEHNSPDDVGYPRCGNCHEDLVVCSQCVHHAGGACGHPAERARYTPDGRAAKSCPAFQSLGLVTSRPMYSSVAAPVWVAGLLGFLVVGTFIASLFMDPGGRYFRGDDVRLETVVPRYARVGGRFYVTLRVANPTERPSSPVFLEINDQSLLGGMPSPDPGRMSRDQERLLLEYPSLPPGGRLVVQIPFVARDPGPLVFQTRLYAPRSQLRQEVLARVSINSAPVEGSG